MSLHHRGVRVCLPLLVTALLAADCGRSNPPLAPSDPSAPFNPPPVESAPPVPILLGPPGVLVGAGDIGMCGTKGAEQTARLIDGIAGTVFTTGDNVYMRGTSDEFRNCYEPTWGRHRSRTRPVPGNHEYETGGAGYYAFFGDRAGPAGGGYYSYAVGPWRVIALNSEISSVPGSAQMEWLRAELASPPSLCTAVYWHRPLFTSGPNGDNPDMRNVWRALYDANVDLVINGHDHNYERFAPQDPDGRPDSQRGIREFIVGTGGATLYPFPQVRANSEVRASVWGVAVFILASGGYQWEFVPVPGAGFRDSGSGVCH
jgi:hypothetical protein